MSAYYTSSPTSRTTIKMGSSYRKRRREARRKKKGYSTITATLDRYGREVIKKTDPDGKVTTKINFNPKNSKNIGKITKIDKKNKKIELKPVKISALNPPKEPSSMKEKLTKINSIRGTNLGNYTSTPQEIRDMQIKPRSRRLDFLTQSQKMKLGIGKYKVKKGNSIIINPFTGKYAEMNKEGKIIRDIEEVEDPRKVVYSNPAQFFIKPAETIGADLIGGLIASKNKSSFIVQKSSNYVKGLSQIVTNPVAVISALNDQIANNPFGTAGEFYISKKIHQGVFRGLGKVSKYTGKKIDKVLFRKDPVTEIEKQIKILKSKGITTRSRGLDGELLRILEQQKKIYANFQKTGLASVKNQASKVIKTYQKINKESKGKTIPKLKNQKLNQEIIKLSKRSKKVLEPSRTTKKQLERMNKKIENLKLKNQKNLAKRYNIKVEPKKTNLQIIEEFKKDRRLGGKNFKRLNKKLMEDYNKKVVVTSDSKGAPKYRVIDLSKKTKKIIPKKSEKVKPPKKKTIDLKKKDLTNKMKQKQLKDKLFEEGQKLERQLQTTKKILAYEESQKGVLTPKKPKTLFVSKKGSLNLKNDLQFKRWFNKSKSKTQRIIKDVKNRFRKQKRDLDQNIKTYKKIKLQNKKLSPNSNKFKQNIKTLNKIESKIKIIQKQNLNLNSTIISIITIARGLDQLYRDARSLGFFEKQDQEIKQIQDEIQEIKQDSIQIQQNINKGIGKGGGGKDKSIKNQPKINPPKTTNKNLKPKPNKPKPPYKPKTKSKTKSRGLVSYTFNSKLPKGYKLKFDGFVKERGKIKKISLGLPPNRSLDKMSKMVDNSTQRSFQLKIIGITKRPDLDSKPKNLKKFRLKKSQNNQVLNVVEKSKYSIDTLGEKKGLNRFKKLKSVKKKSHKKTKKK